MSDVPYAQLAGSIVDTVIVGVAVADVAEVVDDLLAVGVKVVGNKSVGFNKVQISDGGASGRLVVDVDGGGVVAVGCKLFKGIDVANVFVECVRSCGAVAAYFEVGV